MKTARKRLTSTGKKIGFRTGFEHGWRDGACEAAVQSVPPPETVKRELRVLYIPQGFDAIDDGIIEALQRSVKELFVTEPKRMYESALLNRPDLMLVLNGLHVFPDDHLAQVDAVRSLGIRTVIWFVDDPYFTEETVRIAPHYDVIFTHELSTVQLYRTMGCEATQYLPLGVDTSRFKSMRVGDEYRSDVCFIGQAFWNRVAMIDAIAEYLSGLRVFIAGGLWDRLKHYRMLEPVIRHGWLPVEESIKYYNGAKIVINLHRTTEAFSDNRNALALPGRSINPRTFEICACGTLQLTDVRDDLSAYYRSGFELETFTSPEELSSKIHHYLNDEEARKRIAVRGLYRTLRAHSYRSRIHTLLQLLGY